MSAMLAVVLPSPERGAAMQKAWNVVCCIGCSRFPMPRKGFPTGIQYTQKSWERGDGVLGRGSSSSEGFFSLTQTYSIYFSTYPRASYMAPASVIVRGPPMMTRVDISTSSAGKSSSLPIHLAS